MRFHFHTPGRALSAYGRARSVGAGVALLGVVGLGLAALPACGGGGSTGDDAVHLDSSAAALAIGVVGSDVPTPNCAGGGGVGDYAVGGGGVGNYAVGGGGVGNDAAGGGGGVHNERALVDG